MNKFTHWVWNTRFYFTERSLGDSLQHKIDVGVEEARKWNIVGGDGAENGGGADSVFSESLSIFDRYSGGINEPSVGRLDQSKNATITEADFTSAGLTLGSDPLTVQTIEKLRLAQRTSNWQYIHFPIAKSIIDNLKRYTFGRGLKFDCGIPEVKQVLNNFWRGNKMELRMKDLFKTQSLDGEVFLLFFDNAGKDKDFDDAYDPVLVVRTIDSSEISAIEYDIDDRETRLSYLREKLSIVGGQTSTTMNLTVKKLRYLDTTHPRKDSETDVKGLPKRSFNSTKSANIGKVTIEESRIMMLKIGRVSDSRGRPIMESVHRWNRVYLDFCYDRAVLNHLRSKIYMIETRSGKTGKVTASSTVSQPMPKGATMLIETPDRTYRVIAPKTDADNAFTDLKILLYLIGSAFSMPIHILNMNAENENYASIKEAGNPFAQYIQDLQDDWAEHTREIFRYVIYMAVVNGKLNSEYQVDYYAPDSVGEASDYINRSIRKGIDEKEIITEAKHILGEKTSQVLSVFHLAITIIFPDMIQTDPLKQAQALKIHMELGLISKFTARVTIGADPENEEARLAKEEEEDLERQQQMADQFNQGNGLGDEEDEEGEEDETKDKNKEKEEETEEAIFWDEFDEVGEALSLAVRSKKHRQENVKKIAARHAVRVALKSGAITKPNSCGSCKGTGKTLSAHHVNYNKPLDIRWLCAKCHNVRDNKKEGFKK